MSRFTMLIGVLLLSILATAATAQTEDTDGDLVPDEFDNCLLVPNGPNDACNQVDADLDGFGNSCDFDLSNDGLGGGGTDFSVFVDLFGIDDPNSIADSNCDGLVSGADFDYYIPDFFAQPVGPSGLACADPTGATAPCVAP